MKKRIFVPVFAVLVLAAAAGVFLTTEQKAPAPVVSNGNSQTPPVDMQPLRTAQELARSAVAPEEQPLAREALRLADHDTDLAFAVALREAVAHPIPLDGETLDILLRLQDAQKLVAADSQKIAQLAAEAAKTSGEQKNALEEDLQIAKAELELDQDEVADAKEDLIRAGGDPQGRIQRMVEEHEAAAHSVAAAPEAPATIPLPSGGLAGKIREWYRVTQKRDRLLAAQHDAESRACWNCVIFRHSSDIRRSRPEQISGGRQPLGG